jgi:hypothetical protein
MSFRFVHRGGVVAALATLALAAFVPLAGADSVFHTLHAELVPVGNAPLRSGFVNDIHTNGNVNYAHEVYQLNGASPNTTYQVSIRLYLFDPTCSTLPVLIPTTTLTTNGAGNGKAGFTFLAGSIPPPLVGSPHGIAWQLTTGSTVAYQTGCNVLTLD